MANKKNNRKPISSKTKGLICLVFLCALTVFVSVLGIGGMKLDSEGVNILLPWVPLSGANWPQALPLTRALGGGTYSELTAVPKEGVTLEDVAKAMNGRLAGIGETDASVTVQGGDTIRMELRHMDADRLQSVLSLVTRQGHFEFRTSEGAALLTEKDVTGANITVNSTQTSYLVNVSLTDEALKKAQEAEAGYLTAYMDGEQLSSASISDNKLVMSFFTSNFNTASNVTYFINSGAVDASLSLKDSGILTASAGTVKTVVLVIAGLLLLCALVYLLITGRLTGVSAVWTVWCAVLLGLFFTATLVVPSVYALNTGCLIAALLGVLLAVYTAVTRTDLIGRNIRDGQSPKQATKLGLRNSAKQIWIVHGVAIAVALILMIFSFSKSTGYTLAAFVTGSAFTVVLMRAFQACFTAITNKASLFGKTK